MKSLRICGNQNFPGPMPYRRRYAAKPHAFSVESREFFIFHFSFTKTPCPFMKYFFHTPCRFKKLYYLCNAFQIKSHAHKILVR